jgi:Chaperone of endosialidase/Secretion system C-terminal sorting domain
MKKLFFMSLCLAISSSWGQNNNRGTLASTLPPFVTTTTPKTGFETFRFGPGLVTQSDFTSVGNPFAFTADRQWFSIGRLDVGGTTIPGGTTTPLRSLYGFRLQRAGQGLTMGYSGALETTIPTAAGNPFIEWIGNTGISQGNLEFYSASDPSLPSSRRLAFTLRSDLTALFGETASFVLPDVPVILPGEIAVAQLGESAAIPKVEINSTDRQALLVNCLNRQITSSFLNTNGGATGKILPDGTSDTFGTAIDAMANNARNNVGVRANATGGVRRNWGMITNATGTGTGSQNFGIQSTASITSSNTLSSNYGLFSNVNGSTATGSINVGVYGSATGVSTIIPTFPATTTLGTYAGYFNGLVYSTTQITTSDASLKKDVKPEISNIEKLSQLNPVSYNYIQNNEVGLNLPAQLQHGFIAQELEKVYPELVQNLLHPVFNEKKEQTGTKSLKGVNYMGLISVLVASVKELNTEVKTLKEKLASNEKVVVVRNNNNLSNNEIDLINEKGYFLGQNTPNPFKNSTVIEYSLPVTEKNASILIFNLNGQTLKEYKLSETKGSITIDSNVLSKGLYLYSLISEGQEIATKKMLMN